MSVVMIVYGVALGPKWPRPMYLKEFNHNVGHYSGRGEFTQDPTKAKQFADIAEATEFWSRTSDIVPTRPDGKPNKPLTAYTVEIMPMPEADIIATPETSDGG